MAEALYIIKNVIKYPYINLGLFVNLKGGHENDR